MLDSRRCFARFAALILFAVAFSTHAQISRNGYIDTSFNPPCVNSPNVSFTPRALLAAMWRARPQRVYNACDDSELKMGDYFDLAADLYRLPRPPRVPRSTAQEQLPLVLLSFMSESRRLDNARLKKELRLKLAHPTVASGLRA